jgi:ferredoxin
MEGDGPSFGDPRPVGKIVAGRDGVAVDAVCARMIGFENPRGIKLIDLAQKKGLVRFDLDRPEVDGPFQVISGFVHPSSYTANTPGKKSRFATNPETYLQVWSELGYLKPASEDRLCTRCGDCLPACPGGALSLEPLPKIDAAKCASCFSCVEACPEKALTIPMGQELLEKRSRMGM